MRFNKERAEYWQHHADVFKESGLTRKEYCQNNQIKLYQLDYWRRKLKESQANGNLDTRKDWVPLQIHEDHGTDKGSGIRLCIGRMSIEVEPGFNAELLSEVLRVVSTAC